MKRLCLFIAMSGVAPLAEAAGGEALGIAWAVLSIGAVAVGGWAWGRLRLRSATA
ncbi:hypothetical protein [Zestomonas carbonaria]|uniref:Uncharacterized protein n=1 Tax=Zestomonas carbonaria TaxID=2762745 RepID=A0A7U7EML8_9GAMM|nr:hypothetical protein [Pseudomonas carbonaria]CAD5107823.1 hypothetical protein PSEWESI4_02100 [Pseudomonas carbonaria]